MFVKKFGQIVPNFFRIFENSMNSLVFSASFIINSEPIEWNLNSVFANKLWIFGLNFEYW